MTQSVKDLQAEIERLKAKNKKMVIDANEKQRTIKRKYADLYKEYFILLDICSKIDYSRERINPQDAIVPKGDFNVELLEELEKFMQGNELIIYKSNDSTKIYCLLVNSFTNNLGYLSDRLIYSHACKRTDFERFRTELERNSIEHIPLAKPNAELLCLKAVDTDILKIAQEILSE